MTAKNPVAYLDRLVPIALPNRLVRGAVGCTAIAIGLFIGALDAAVLVVALVTTSLHLVALGAIWALPAVLFLGFGISAIRSRPQFAPTRTGWAQRRPGRIDVILHAIATWARAHQWIFALGLAGAVFALGFVGSSRSGWDAVVGNSVGGALVAAITARLLRLWPHNRLLHWHRS